MSLDIATWQGALAISILGGLGANLVLFLLKKALPYTKARWASVDQSSLLALPILAVGTLGLIVRLTHEPLEETSLKTLRGSVAAMLEPRQIDTCTEKRVARLEKHSPFPFTQEDRESVEKRAALICKKYRDPLS